ncbi:MAG TPA: aminotransferase class IV [Puia sp.]|nr:aminotransferase class IV [Puia sp.]
MALSSSSNYNGIVSCNGVHLPAGQPLLTADNRGFRYGDGLFETMFVQEGRIRLAEYHFDRLLSGMAFLDFEIPSSFAEKLTKEIRAVCEANGLSGAVAARVRLVIFRGESSFSGPPDRFPNYIIQSWPLSAVHEPVEGGLAIGIFPDGRKACDRLSNLKSNNYLLYILAAHYAKKQGLDDCLVLNSQNRVVDSSIASLFYIRQGQFYTPPLSEGVVAGVMRRHLLDALPRAGYIVHEQPVTPEDLLTADEIFLTNALKGISPVRSLLGKAYTDRLAAAVYERLVKVL